jgi:predicted transposase/invertase (TIGR01784 family)
MPGIKTRHALSLKKQTTKPHDRFVKELLSHHDAAVEFLMNALPQIVIDVLDMKSLQYANVSYTTEELHEYMSDVVLRIPYLNSKASAEVTVLIEHKSYKDRMTPFQMMAYLTSGYREQIKNGNKFSLIIPVVYYHGKQKWQIPSLVDYFPDAPAALLKYVPQFSMEMLSIREMTAAQIYAITNGMLRAAFMVQKGAHKRIFALEEYARMFNTISAEQGGNFFISMMVYIFESGALEVSEFSNIAKELDNDMKTKTMTIKEEWIAEGLEKGIEKGIGLGIEQENLRSRYEFARKLLLRNMPLEEICELTDLSMEEVKRLAAETSDE